jgi:hypothetical protein
MIDTGRQRAARGKFTVLRCSICAELIGAKAYFARGGAKLCAKHGHILATPLQTSTCFGCARMLLSQRGSLPFCSHNCRGRARRARARAGLRCVECGKKLEAKRGDARFCSGGCIARDFRRRHPTGRAVA